MSSNSRLEFALADEAQAKFPANDLIRRIGINPNCWYMIAKCSELGEQPLEREIWNEPIVLFRTERGQVRALENRCAHRLVKLSHGRVIGEQIECAYHGWRFNGAGQCVHIPHLAGKPSLRDCRIKSFPAMEKHGFVWIFPGDPERSQAVTPMAMTEWDDLNEIPSVARFQCRAHFSYLVENLMDMYHGKLHAQYQVWTAEALQEVMQTDDRVAATYRAITYYRVQDLSSLLQLFFPSLRRLHHVPLTVAYEYPNWRSTLGEDFKIYCLIRPVNDRLTDAYLIHYTSIGKLDGLKHLPPALRRLLKLALSNVAKRLLDNLVRQDVLMIEEEQRAFDHHPLRAPLEVNRTILRVQQLIRRQAARRLSS